MAPSTTVPNRPPIHPSGGSCPASNAILVNAWSSALASQPIKRTRRSKPCRRIWAATAARARPRVQSRIAGIRLMQRPSLMQRAAWQGYSLRPDRKDRLSATSRHRSRQMLPPPPQAKTNPDRRSHGQGSATKALYPARSRWESQPSAGLAPAARCLSPGLPAMRDEHGQAKKGGRCLCNKLGSSQRPLASEGIADMLCVTEGVQRLGSRAVHYQGRSGG